jgi:hypothetical protein
MQVLPHLTTALGLLQQRILSADLTDDESVAATIVGLITIDTIFEDWSSYHVYSKYLRALLMSRGGSEKPRVAGMVYLWLLMGRIKMGATVGAQSHAGYNKICARATDSKMMFPHCMQTLSSREKIFPLAFRNSLIWVS